MNKAFFISIIIGLTLDAFSQDLSIDPSDIEWSEGSITLEDETKIKGLLKYNDKTGILSFESGRDSRSFTPRTVRQFEFFDNISKGNRKFYSIPYEDPKDGMKHPYFFEVLKEFETFALLSKTDPIEVKQKRSSAYNPAQPSGAYPVNSFSRIVVSQNETLYIFDAQGNIEPYLKFTSQEIESTFFWMTAIERKNLY